MEDNVGAARQGIVLIMNTESQLNHNHTGGEFSDYLARRRDGERYGGGRVRLGEMEMGGIASLSHTAFSFVLFPSLYLPQAI